MENNTVILSLFEYNRLRDFYQKINENHTHKVISNSNSYGFYSNNETEYISTDVAVGEISKANKDLKERIDELIKKNFDLEQNIKKLEKEKKKSSFNFLKWLIK
jgi:uncharacterized protein YeeX (DUF496 family)